MLYIREVFSQFKNMTLDMWIYPLQKKLPVSLLTPSTTILKTRVHWKSKECFKFKENISTQQEQLARQF